MGLNKILIFCFLGLFSGCNSIEVPDEQSIKYEINMTWEQVDCLLKKHIKTKPNVTTGLADIKNLLTVDSVKNIVDGIDTLLLKKEFIDWLAVTINNNAIPKSIKSIGIGIFTLFENNKENTTAYLYGSMRSPNEDPKDWNVEPKYFPKSYFVPSAFDNINREFQKLNGNQEVLIFNGILNLMIINYFSEFKPKLLTSENSLYVGCGFDAGETYLIGQLTMDGLK